MLFDLVFFFFIISCIRFIVFTCLIPKSIKPLTMARGSVFCVMNFRLSSIRMSFVLLLFGTIFLYRE